MVLGHLGFFASVRLGTRDLDLSYRLLWGWDLMLFVEAASFLLSLSFHVCTASLPAPVFDGDLA